MPATPGILLADAPARDLHGRLRRRARPGLERRNFPALFFRFFGSYELR
ncbi:hypothetical protein [Streptomyces caeruleatus]|nr:hypothetical protein [Streptomyces caeruleatus]